jgi:SAM-dependent methyltransferase
MSYYKNTEIATKFKVSNSTVGEWVKGARAGKNNLQIRKYRNKDRILENEHNEAEMVRLKEKGIKYKTARARKIVKPSSSFYKVFNKEQIIEIINDLETRSLINLKFAYDDKGADYWVEFYNNPDYKHPIKQKELFSIYAPVIGQHLDNVEEINILDVGAGTGDPAIWDLEVLKMFSATKGVNVTRYVALDISEKLLELAKNTVKQEFPDVQVETIAVDIENSNLMSVLNEYRVTHDKKVANVVILQGAIFGNVDDPIKTMKNIRRALNSDDIVIVIEKFDKEEIRLNTSYYSVGEKESGLFYWIPDMMGVDTQLCNNRTEFVEKDSCRNKYLIVDKDYEIEFEIDGGVHRVFLTKDQEVKYWTHRLFTFDHFQEVARRSNYQIAFMGLNADSEYAIACLKTKKQSLN